MKIEGFYLGAFGVLEEIRMENLSPGLNVFYGANESGKTTLKEFILWMLFGPPKSRGVNKYEPPSGKQQYGRLYIVTKDGRGLMVERRGRKISWTERSGKTVGERSTHPSFLKIIDRGTYSRVFGIGLRELAGLDALKQTHIFAAGSGLSGVSLKDVFDTIKKKREHLLGGRRAKKPINKHIEEIRRISNELGEARKRPKDYQQLLQKKKELEHLHKKLQIRKRELTRRAKHIDLLKKIHRQYEKIRRLDSQIKELHHVEKLPPNAKMRYEKLKGNFEELMSEINEMESSLQELCRKIDALYVDENLLAQATAIEALVSKRDAYERAVADLPTLEEKERNLVRKLQDELRALGSDVTEEMLDKMDLSVAAQSKASDLISEMRTAEEELREAQTRKRTAQTLLKEKHNKLSSLKESLRQWHEKAPKRDDSDERSHALRQLRDALREENTLKNMLTVLPPTKVIRNELPTWLLLLFLSAVLVGAVICFALREYLGGGLLVAFAAGLLLWRRFRRAPSEPVDKIHQFQKMLNETQQKIADAAKKLGVSVPPDEKTLLKLEQQLDEERRIADNLERLKEQCEIAEKEYEEAKRDFEECEKAEKRSEMRLKELMRRWENFLNQSALPHNVKPNVYDAFKEAFQRARNIKEQLMDHKARIQTVKNHITSVEMEIRSVLASLGRPTHTVSHATIDDLINQLKNAQKTAQKRISYEEKKKETEAKLKSKKERLCKIDAELKAILKKAGADDEEDFYSICEDYDQLKELKKQRKILYESLCDTADGEDNLKNYIEELDNCDIETLDEEKKKIEDELEKLTGGEDEEEGGEIGRLWEELRNTENQIEEMEQEEEVSRLRQQFETLHEDVRRELKEWAAFALCEWILKKTKETYEKERQPKVIRQANEFFKRMTNNRYKIIVRLDDEEIVLESEDEGMQKDKIKWSDGLADQVYLSMRLGLACEWGKDSEPLPLILDDVLVRFDPERQKGCAEALVKVAQNIQVLLFTCHPETVKFLHSAAQKTNTTILSHTL